MLRLSLALQILVLAPAVASAAVPADLSGVRPGPVMVTSSTDSLTVSWSDEKGTPWVAEFSLEPRRPLITSISSKGAAVLTRGVPFYECQTGKRRGGWDEFFDFPPSHPDGTRSFRAAFQLKAARAETIGDRVEVTFEGLKMGIFEGTVRYLFFPGSRLIEQAAVMSTSEPDVAFFYNAGLRMGVDRDRRPGGNMESYISYYDTNGDYQTLLSGGSEQRPLAVRYRTLAAHTGDGSVAVFPAPHRYFIPRDFTTNMGFVWHSSWRGNVSLGIRQLPDDDSRFYPWANAPPGTSQRLSLFLMVTAGSPQDALQDVLRYTRNDRLPALKGYQALTSHWHYAYTVQAMERGFDWTPPFKPVLKSLGVDAAMIMDFHGDGHPSAMTEIRVQELDAFFKACRAQTDRDFLLIPGEEANVHLGGHWAVSFPKPVYWYLNRKPDQPYKSQDPKYGTVYRVADAKELLNLIREENGFVYQTHPRTKGSKTFPDDIKETEHFRDPHYWGAGWKQMPTDYSSPRLGERALKLLDDMNNWGLKKRILGEVDVFQIDHTHELYAHMNVNYVKLPELPSFENYGALLQAMERGDFFVTTGEVLLYDTAISENAAGGISVRATVEHTFPLQMAEIVWGDGTNTSRKLIPLTSTHQFGKKSYAWETDAPNWKWARVAVWDVAADGAFVNPVWRKP